MKLVVTAAPDPTASTFEFGGRQFRCAIGAGGMAADKQEGDHASPVGVFPLRRLFFRPDRLERPHTALPILPLTPFMGWSDDPADPDHYNRLVSLPYNASHEALWRDDHVYDIIVEIGYNDAPPVPGKGSAIFMHVARPDFSATEGCVALALRDLLAVVAHCTRSAKIEFKPF